MTGDRDKMRERSLAIAALAILAMGAPLPFGSLLWIKVLIALAGLGIAAIALQRPGPAAAVAVLAAAIETVTLTGMIWQIVMPGAVAGLAIATRYWPALGPVGVPLGRVPAWATFACGAVTPGALVGWVLLMQPDLSDLTGAIPDVPLAVLVLGAIVFALLNALFEEWIWRGIFQSRLEMIWSPAAALCLQAVSFGLAHAHGFPRGLVGVALAGSWGLLLGGLRLYAGGLLAPTLAHIVADATIAIIVLFWLR